jgi:hypothetical protein
VCNPVMAPALLPAWAEGPGGTMLAQQMTIGGRGANQTPWASPPGDSSAALIEAGVLLASELSLPTLLRRLVEIAVTITHAQYGALGVSGPQGGIVEFITVGLSDEQRAAIGTIPTGREFWEPLSKIRIRCVWSGCRTTAARLASLLIIRP